MSTLTIEIFKPEIFKPEIFKPSSAKNAPNARKGSLKITNKGETSMTIRPVVSGRLDEKFVERASTVLLRGILWSSLAICVLAALFYGIASWLAGS
jgi:hypothetical protein